MARLPWFAFYPTDWFLDTRCLSLAARGAWIDVLGILWHSKTRGSRALDMEGWASELGKSLPEIQIVFDELRHRDIATFVTGANGTVTVSSRRMVREETIRESTRCRAQRFREKQCNGPSNGSVTLEKTEVRRQKAELREQEDKPSLTGDSPPKASTNHNSKAKMSDEEWIETLKANAAYSHIDFLVEQGKIDAWQRLEKNKHRKITRQFMLNWFNRIEKPFGLNGREKHKPLPQRTEPINRGQWQSDCPKELRGRLGLQEQEDAP